MKKAKSIKEAMSVLDEILFKTDKDEHAYILSMKTCEDMIVYHTTVGRDIRNQWGLWDSKENSLKEEEIKKLGINEHPDDISMFILKLFYTHVKSPETPIETIINEFCIKKLLE